jgi:selenoprotein W-related protein
MSSVEIEYCVPCGFLPRAQDLQKELLDTFGQELDRVALVTGDGGVFRVDVDGDTVFDKAEAGDGYEVEDVVGAVRAEL